MNQHRGFAALAALSLTVLVGSGCASSHKTSIAERAPTRRLDARASIRTEIRKELDAMFSDEKAPDSLDDLLPLSSAGQAKAAFKDQVPSLASGMPTQTQPTPAPTPETKPEAKPEPPKPEAKMPPQELKKLSTLESAGFELSSPNETPLIFDIPVTYNERVRQWIHFFQSSGRSSFRRWLERSSRYLPVIQYELTKAGLPQDLVYVAMIESGFSPSAVSHKAAMGMWQFIAPTGRRYGLKVDWWIDERKDFSKATRAAIDYMRDLHKQFNSWYLVAASYNMGENGVARLIARHGTNNFWDLADRGALPRETRDYVPKIIAAMLISKAPALYGFRDIEYQMPLSFETLPVPGGTDIITLASYLGVSEKYMKELNPELVKGFVPRNISDHKIRVPKGSLATVSKFVSQHRQ